MLIKSQSEGKTHRVYFIYNLAQTRTGTTADLMVNKPWFFVIISIWLQKEHINLQKERGSRN